MLDIIWDLVDPLSNLDWSCDVETFVGSSKLAFFLARLGVSKLGNVPSCSEPTSLVREYEIWLEF